MFALNERDKVVFKRSFRVDQSGVTFQAGQVSRLRFTVSFPICIDRNHRVCSGYTEKITSVYRLNNQTETI